MGEDELRALGDELMRLNRRRTAAYPGSRLDTSAFRVLWLLAEGPPRTLRDVAEELQLDPSTVNRQVNAAIQNGLLERYAVDGSPSRLLRPTAAGRTAYEYDAALRGAAYGAAMDALGAAGSAELIALLGRFNDALDEALRAPQE
jgi:DNA-binding MarR family transcriptional regulator